MDDTPETLLHDMTTKRLHALEKELEADIRDMPFVDEDRQAAIHTLSSVRRELSCRRVDRSWNGK